MKRFLVIILTALCGVFTAAAQLGPTSTLPAHTVVILPFENASKAPGLEWVSESFPEVFGQRLAAAPLYVMPREDRAVAFDRAGIPTNARLSRATLYRIAEQMDADFVILGRYDYDGQTFSASANLLDMKRLHLSLELKEAGALVKLIDIETALTWDVLKLLAPDAAGSRESFLAATPAVRLDAFENYIRGLVAASRPERIRRFREAIRLNPNYTLAMLELGHTYFDSREYESAAAWLAKVPSESDAAREANFYLGLSAYYLGDYERAERAFSFLAAQLPLTEVYNNLGAAAARRGKRAALEYFQKAVQADPSDADYHFNYALALYKAGDPAGASRQLREVLNLRASDTEAKSLLDTLSRTTQSNGAAHMPAERIKRNYDETSFQQLSLEIENATERRLANADARTHAAFHVERGREFYKQGFRSQAEKEFREAVRLDASNAAAHAGLAQLLEQGNDLANARSEAEAAVRLQASAEALLVLARLDLKANQPQSASQNVDRALALEPSNAEALALRRTLAEKGSASPR